MTEYQHLNKWMYSSRRWSTLRQAQLAKEPLCRMCQQVGQITEATVVDHIRPHRGDKQLFFNTDNLQSLCKHCHDAHKQSYERTGKLRGCGVDGAPIDKNHHWHTQGGQKSEPTAPRNAALLFF